MRGIGDHFRGGRRTRGCRSVQCGGGICDHRTLGPAAPMMVGGWRAARHRWGGAHRSPSWGRAVCAIRVDPGRGSPPTCGLDFPGPGKRRQRRACGLCPLCLGPTCRVGVLALAGPGEPVGKRAVYPASEPLPLGEGRHLLRCGAALSLCGLAGGMVKQRPSKRGGRGDNRRPSTGYLADLGVHLDHPAVALSPPQIRPETLAPLTSLSPRKAFQTTPTIVRIRTKNSLARTEQGPLGMDSGRNRCAYHHNTMELMLAGAKRMGLAELQSGRRGDCVYATGV